MASQKAIDRLYRLCRRAEHDTTLPALDEPFVKRWISGFSPWQLDALNMRTAPIDFRKKKGDSLSDTDARVARMVAKVVRFYEDNDKFDAMLDIPLGNLTLEDNSGTEHNDEKGFAGIYAPLTKFNIPQLNFHWSTIAIPMLNILPHYPAAQKLAHDLNSVTEGPSALATIQTYLEALGKDWHGVTNFALEHFRSRIGSLDALPAGSKVRIFMDLIPHDSLDHIGACQHPWFSCDVAAMTILALALPAHKLSTLRDGHNNAPNPMLQAHSFSELFEAELLPSASLRKAFDYAKAAARGTQKRTTVMMVSLVDTEEWRLPHYIDKKLQYKKMHAREYHVLSHFFVVGVGPEGMRMWQSWKYLGPRLEEHMALGGARVRGWQEADAFVDMFEDLVSRDVGKVSLSKNVPVCVWKRTGMS